MGKRFNAIPQAMIEFIAQQKLFFVATALAEGRVNLSPKGMDSFRVIDENRVVWLNVTGSGNETATHIQHNPRMTVMFCAFEGAPLILRLYGQAKVIHSGDSEWHELSSLFPPLPGARQIFDLNVDLVQSSCGMSVPFFEYQTEREQLSQWAEKKGKAGIEQYWSNKNQTSIDGIETHILSKGGVQ